MVNRKRYLASLMASVSLLAMPYAALAAEQQASVEEVVVSGSRIRTDGYEAPTPVTVVPVDDLLKSTPSSIITALTTLPQFINSQNPSEGGKAGIGSGRGNFLNLRNVGAQRTLTLLDNVRMPPTTYNGRVNAEVIPQMLIQRVEVVTAGASAAYGSDAIAGVVNYLLDHDFTGYKAEAVTGISTYGDSFNYRVGGAGGFKLGDRGHLLMSVERFNSDAIQMKDRPEGLKSCIRAGQVIGGTAPGSATNPYINWCPNATWTAISDGGHVTSGPLKGTYFASAGVARPYNEGTRTGTGGFGIGGDGAVLQPEQTITEDVNTNNGFARASYEVTDSINAHISAIYSYSSVHASAGFNYFDFNHAIYSGNPYIPAAQQAILTSTNTASFTIQKYISDAPLSPGVDVTNHYTLIAGFDGKLEDGGLGNNYTWNVNYARGYTHQLAEERNTPEERNLYAAADAVRNSAGVIVCNVSITNPAAYPGCVPLNLLGKGAASQAGLEYTYGTSRYDTFTILDQVSASLQGEPFSLWAGPVSIAMGGEYRRQSLNLKSNSDPSVFRPVNGVRGLLDTAPRFWYSNVASARGAVTVKEAFGEVNVPLLTDKPFFDSLDANAAVRVTDYSSSGTVTTWKIGGTWRLASDISFRGTRSRDIRAPTVFDLFSSGSSGRSTVNDPHTSTSIPVVTISGGNRNLKPETGNTLTVGTIFTPSVLPDFSIAIDYFKLNLSNAISTLSAQNIVNQCEFSNGLDPICNQITRPLPFSDKTVANVPTLIRNAPSNSSFIKTRGFDIEASYRTALGGGTLTSRVFLTFIDSYRTQQSILLPVIEFGGTNDTPEIKAVLSATYTMDEYSLFVQERITGRQKFGQAPLNYHAMPAIPVYGYTDVTAGYRLAALGGESNLFFTVRNLLNKRPPLYGNAGAPRFGFPTISGYDIIGRSFSMGVRAKF